MLTPYRARGVTLQNRIVVSPMAMYSARDGLINDFHIAHLGARAMGGAGLVFAEMTCVSPDARITPGCLGLWNDEQAAGWKRLGRFDPFGRPGEGWHSARPCRPQRLDAVAWEGIDQPLETGGWPLISASRSARICPHSPVPARDDPRGHGAGA